MLINVKQVADNYHLWNFEYLNYPRKKALKLLLQQQGALALIPGTIADQHSLPQD